MPCSKHTTYNKNTINLEHTPKKLSVAFSLQILHLLLLQSLVNHCLLAALALKLNWRIPCSIVTLSLSHLRDYLQQLTLLLLFPATYSVCKETVIVLSQALSQNFHWSSSMKILHRKCCKTRCIPVTTIWVLVFKNLIKEFSVLYLFFKLL